METESVIGTLATVPVIQRDLSINSLPSPVNMFSMSSPPPLQVGVYHYYLLLSSSGILIGVDAHNNRAKSRPSLSMDLVEDIKGMYRLLDLISESGSNNCRKRTFLGLSNHGLISFLCS